MGRSAPRAPSAYSAGSVGGASVLSGSSHGVVSAGRPFHVSSSHDSSDSSSGIDFTSSNEDRISVSRGPVITPSDIVALPKGQAFVLMEGGQLWKVRIPLPAKERDPTLPQDLKAMAQAMHQNYATAEHWWSEYEA